MIKIKDYQLQFEIGKGKYGKVYKGKNLQTEETIAVKKIQKSLIRNDITKELLSQEISCMKLLQQLQSERQNENIVKFIEFIESQSNYYIIMEYCNGTDLKQLLAKQGHFSESEAIQKFSQLLNGFKLLEENQIMHRDIKTANIFLHNDCLKIGDFGFACQAEKQTLKLGTPLYMAPELLRSEKYDSKVDIWALGVIFYQLLFGIFPFKADKITQLEIYETTKPDFKYQGIQISEPIQLLIEKMLTVNREERISWNELFHYKFGINKQEEYSYLKPQSLEQSDEKQQKENLETKQWQEETQYEFSPDKQKILVANAEIESPENFFTADTIRQIQNYEALSNVNSHCFSLQTSCSEMRKISQQTFDAIIQDVYADES